MLNDIRIFIALTCFFTLQVNAIDNVKMLRPVLGEDKRAKHKDEVILRSLEVSTEKYGDFNFESINVDMTPSRALSSTKEGGLINIFIAPASKHWESETIPIKIPIRLGLLSYRLLLVNKHEVEKFSTINSLADLKKLTAGLQRDWVTTNVFKASNIKAVLGHNFEGLFLMLNKNRFDYIPRAIYEIFDELDNRQSQLQNVVIEPTLALYIPMGTYVYVSPEHPEIAERIEFGLRAMVESGELKRILFKYYQQNIIDADLKNRKIITINNPYYLDSNVLSNDELWLKL